MMENQDTVVWSWLSHALIGRGWRLIAFSLVLLHPRHTWDVR